MSWSTCRGAGKNGWRGEKRRTQWFSGEVGRRRKGYNLLFIFFCEVTQVEVVFVCVILKFCWQSSLVFERLSLPPELQFARTRQYRPLHVLQLWTIKYPSLCFAFRFSFYHDENCTSWKCENESGSRRVQRWHTVCTQFTRNHVRVYVLCMCVSHFCCLLTWSMVLNGDLWETALLQSGLDQKWTRPSRIQLNSIWLWSQVWSHTLQTPWISFFGLLFIIFFLYYTWYLHVSAVTEELYKTNWH